MEYMNSNNAKYLSTKIEEIQSLMIAYVTGKRTDEQPSQYKDAYDEVFFLLEENGYENPNPHKSLEIFWSYCKLQNMDPWAKRRAYIQEMYADILLDLKRIQRNEPDPKNWKKTNEILIDSLSPVIPICNQDDTVIYFCHGGMPWRKRFKSVLKTYKEPSSYVIKQQQ